MRGSAFSPLERLTACVGRGERTARRASAMAARGDPGNTKIKQLGSTHRSDKNVRGLGHYGSPLWSCALPNAAPTSSMMGQARLKDMPQPNTSVRHHERFALEVLGSRARKPLAIEVHRMYIDDVRMAEF